jgi:hypothetical protein
METSNKSMELCGKDPSSIITRYGNLEVSPVYSYLYGIQEKAEHHLLLAYLKSDTYQKYKEYLVEIKLLPRVFFNKYYPLMNYIHAANPWPPDELEEIDPDQYERERDKCLNMPEMGSIEQYINLFMGVQAESDEFNRAMDFLKAYAKEKKNDMNIIDYVACYKRMNGEDNEWVVNVKDKCMNPQGLILDAMMNRQIPPYVWFRDNWVFDHLKNYLIFRQEEDYLAAKATNKALVLTYQNTDDYKQRQKTEFSGLDALAAKGKDVEPSKVIVEVEYDHKIDEEKRKATKIFVSYEGLLRNEESGSNDLITDEFDFSTLEKMLDKCRSDNGKLLYRLARACTYKTGFDGLLGKGTNYEKEASALNGIFKAMFQTDIQKGYIDFGGKTVIMQLKLRNRREKKGVAKSIGDTQNPPSEQGG